jgi:hydrogenase maturation protease
MSGISVIGLGNVFLGDDSFGPLAIENFCCTYEIPANVDVLDLGTPGLDLAPYLYDQQLVLVVDTVHSDIPIGTLSLFHEADFLSHRAKLRITGHDPGLWDALAHLRLAGHAPAELIILGVNPNSCEFAEPMTDEISELASSAAAIIAHLLRDHGISCTLRQPAAKPNLWWLPIPLPQADSQPVKSRWPERSSSQPAA